MKRTARHAPDHASPYFWVCTCGRRYDTAAHLDDHLYQARGDALAARMVRHMTTDRRPYWRRVLRNMLRWNPRTADPDKGAARRSSRERA